MSLSLSKIARTTAAIAAAGLLAISAGLALREMDRLEKDRGEKSAVMVFPKIDGSGGNSAGQEDFAAAYDGVFQTTVYYTPREDGFEKSAGFDMTPEKRPGLQGKQFPRDFLKAVAVEGFGKMKTAAGGKQYLCCNRGQWSFAAQPMDSVGQPLQALRSSAVGGPYQLIQPQANFRVKAAGLPAAFLDAQWLVCDTGSGLKARQIDLYWGEDAPLGPGARLSRPRGLPDHIEKPTILVLR